MSSVSDVIDQQNALAILTFDRLGSGWQRSTSVFVSLGVTARIEQAVDTGVAVIHTPPADLAEFEAWSRLREVMAEPDQGAWFTGRLRLDSSGAYQFEFSWDDEPRWPLLIDIDGQLVDSLPVENSELREDMVMHPRPAATTPPWLIERLGASPLHFSDRWDARLEPLESSPNWSIVREMVRDTIQLLGDDRDAVLERDVITEAVYSELLASTRVSQMMRLLRDAAAAGVVDEPAQLNSDEGGPSRDAIRNDQAFHRNVVVLLSLIDQLADQEIANVVKS